MSGKLASKIWY